jgi:hypothetical protein
MSSHATDDKVDNSNGVVGFSWQTKGEESLVLGLPVLAGTIIFTHSNCIQDLLLCQQLGCSCDTQCVL